MSNHDVQIDGDVVRKRYRRTDRGEPEREWAALVLLDQHAPGLAPRPIALEDDPPVVVMSRIVGDPLDRVLTPERLAAVLDAYRSLFAVPPPADTPRRYWEPGAFFRSNLAWIEEEHERADLSGTVARGWGLPGTGTAPLLPGSTRSATRSSLRATATSTTCCGTARGCA